MFCHNCGKPVDGVSRYCPSCGAVQKQRGWHLRCDTYGHQNAEDERT